MQNIKSLSLASLEASPRQLKTQTFSKALLKVGLGFSVLAAALIPSIANAEHYNRSAAASYGWQYALSYNGYYPSFGNDCTNFVSQCLKAGGMSNRGSNYNDSGHWFFTKSWNGWTQWSYSWAVANGLENFLFISGRANLTSFNGLRAGDVVACDWNGRPDGTADHMMIVTGAGYIDGVWQVFVSYHSNNRQSVPLYSLVSRYPAGTFRYWHVRDDY